MYFRGRCNHTHFKSHGTIDLYHSRVAWHIQAMLHMYMYSTCYVTYQGYAHVVHATIHIRPMYSSCNVTYQAYVQYMLCYYVQYLLCYYVQYILYVQCSECIFQYMTLCTCVAVFQVLLQYMYAIYILYSVWCTAVCYIYTLCLATYRACRLVWPMLCPLSSHFSL